MITDVEGMFSGYALLSHLTGEGEGEGSGSGERRGQEGERRGRGGGEEGERRRCVHAAQFEVLMKEKQCCYSIYTVL